MTKEASPPMKLITPGFILAVVGATYLALNAIYWGWWNIDLKPDRIAPGAIYDGYTLSQLIAMRFGWLAGPLILAALIMLILGLIMIMHEGSQRSLRKWLKQKILRRGNKT
ncbi:MAG: hypothetical protein QXL10_00950 [Candidatus Bathyarchaeia archaeon]